MVTGCYEHVSARDVQDTLVLTIEAKEICQPEVAASLQQEISSAFHAEGRRHVIVDLHNIEFISSVGYAPLISLRQHVTSAGGKLVLCGLTSFVRDVFATSQMLVDAKHPGAMFYCADSVEQAIDLLAQIDSLRT